MWGNISVNINHENLLFSEQVTSEILKCIDFDLWRCSCAFIEISGLESRTGTPPWLYKKVIPLWFHILTIMFWITCEPGITRETRHILYAGKELRSQLATGIWIPGVLLIAARKFELAISTINNDWKISKYF